MEYKMEMQEIQNLPLEELEKIHDSLHIKFSHLLAGEPQEITLKQLHTYHSIAISEIARSGGQHIGPIDNLDKIQLLEENVTARKDETNKTKEELSQKGKIPETQSKKHTPKVQLTSKKLGHVL